jgi:hypothetical protein
MSDFVYESVLVSIFVQTMIKANTLIPFQKLGWRN